MLYYMFIAGSYGAECRPVHSIKGVREMAKNLKEHDVSILAIIRGGTDIVQQIDKEIEGER